jgi:hypothetical protein
MLKKLRENPVTHVAGMVAVTVLNVVVSVRDSTQVVCIHCRRLVVNGRPMAIAMSDLAIRLRLEMIVLVVHEQVIALSHLARIWVEKLSVSVVRILVVRRLLWRTPDCVVRRHGLSSRIALRRVVGLRIPDDLLKVDVRRIQADLNSLVVLLRDVRARVDHLQVELKRLVVRWPMIRETMPSVLVMGLMWKSDSRQHAVSVGRNAVSALRLVRTSSFLPASAMPR